MRTFIATLLASAITVVAISAAHAADAIDQVPEAPIANDPVGVPAGNWAGAYGGATLQHNWGRFGTQKDYDAKALGGSVYGGYNMQDDKVVYGVEADLGYNGGNTMFGAGVEGKQGVNGSLRGRVGYDVNPVLVYGTAGVAASNNKLKDAGGASDERVALGYTVGAGVEGFVTDKITARAEYRYSDYQEKSYNLTAGKTKADYDDHSLKVGLGYKF